ncbi:chromate transporter [Rhodoferax sp. U11-2br]|uniref:chromate transporter n=1 Tax=Rhodoferax sp. U11-2br TaxID=2838878 RepID=UPI001BE9A661|nr:chromate transporter [Rhodoferax sp. U11-2br]MBT3065318.1 chromate transporter [Rhodoferax sp. U11-2br]
MIITMTAADWLLLLTHFLSLSLLAIGGAVSTLPDMHRMLVNDQHWLLDSQFNASVALAQAAPGPNVLFVALLGWNVGLNASGAAAGSQLAWAYGLAGMALAMLGVLLPSTTLTLMASRWAHHNRDLRAVRAFKQGMAPVVVGLLLATGAILALNPGNTPDHWPLWLLSASCALLVWRTKLHLLWLLGAGALLGWWGLV